MKAIKANMALAKNGRFNLIENKTPAKSGPIIILSDIIEDITPKIVPCSLLSPRLIIWLVIITLKAECDTLNNKEPIIKIHKKLTPINKKLKLKIRVALIINLFSEKYLSQTFFNKTA